MRKLRVLLLLGAVLLEAGCGLPDTYFLQPPTVVTPAIPGNYLFAFSNPVHDYVDTSLDPPVYVHPPSSQDVNASFTGDELYYKIYGNNAVEANAYDSSSPTDPSVQLTNKGFYPLVLATDTAPVSRTDPVIAVNFALAAAGSTVTVTINQAASPNPYSSFCVLATNPPLEVRRGVEDLNAGQPLYGYYKSFQYGITTDPSYWGGPPPPPVDADFASAYTTLQQVPASVIYIAWYAISFGYTLSGTPVRSTPVYLGYISISYP